MTGTHQNKELMYVLKYTIQITTLTTNASFRALLQIHVLFSGCTSIRVWYQAEGIRATLGGTPSGGVNWGTQDKRRLAFYPVELLRTLSQRMLLVFVAKSIFLQAVGVGFGPPLLFIHTCFSRPHAIKKSGRLPLDRTTGTQRPSHMPTNGIW